MKLVGGASAAQFIPLAIAPVLTRLYSPAEYGVLATFVAVAAILTAVASGRYAVAIMLPDVDRDAVQITGLALLLGAGVSLLLLFLAPVTLGFLGDVDMVHSLGGWLYFLPVAVFLGSMFESLGYFSLRKDKVTEIAKANVMKAAVSGGSQVALGFIGVGTPGLLGGSLLGLATGNFRLIRIYADSVRASRLRWSQMKSMAAKYSNFPKYDLWANLANNLSYNVIVIGVGAIYAAHALGQYALAYRFVSLPSALLGAALGQVYLREAARRVKSPALALRAFYRTAALLIAVSVVPMVVIWIWGQALFAITFGPEWRLSGVYAAAMMPLVWARFVASPLSSVFHIYGRQRLLLVFQSILLGLVGVTMGLASKLGWSLQQLLVVQSIFMGGFYVVILFAAGRIIVLSGGTEAKAESPAQAEPPDQTENL